MIEEGTRVIDFGHADHPILFGFIKHVWKDHEPSEVDRAKALNKVLVKIVYINAPTNKDGYTPTGRQTYFHDDKVIIDTELARLLYT